MVYFIYVTSAAVHPIDKQVPGKIYTSKSLLSPLILKIPLNSRQDPGGDRLGGDVAAPLLAALGGQVNVDVVGEGVLDDDRAGAVRVERGNGLDAAAAGVGVAAGAVEDGGADGDELAELGHHVVGSLEGVLAVVDGDETGAGAAATAGQVRAVLGGGAQGPGGNARGPVLERAHGEAGGLVPGAGGGSPALGHVLLRVGELVPEVGQDGPVQVGGIAVPGNGRDIVGSNAHDLLGEDGLVCRICVSNMELVVFLSASRR